MPKNRAIAKKFWQIDNRKTDLGRPSFQFEEGFSTAIFQALNYLADSHSKFAFFIIHVHRTVLLYISVIIQ